MYGEDLIKKLADRKFASPSGDTGYIPFGLKQSAESLNWLRRMEETNPAEDYLSQRTPPPNQGRNAS
jgi:hypothetical protein